MRQIANGLLDFPARFTTVLDAQLTSARQKRDIVVEQLSKQYAAIVNGADTKDKGVLDFPLSTMAKDVQNFSKKILRLATLTEFATQEGLPSPTRLAEVLNRMRDGKTAANNVLQQ